MAELVDALVSNNCGKPCRFEPGPGYKASLFEKLFLYPVAGLRPFQVCGPGYKASLFEELFLYPVAGLRPFQVCGPGYKAFLFEKLFLYPVAGLSSFRNHIFKFPPTA